MTTLAGDIDSAVLQLTASSATHGKQIGYQFELDGEAFVLDGFGVSSHGNGYPYVEDRSIWLVSRGLLGTTKAAHTSGAVIAGIIPEFTKNVTSVRQSGVVVAGSTLAATQADHDGKTILLAALAGSVVTLPAALGSGCRIRAVVGVLATSVSHKVQVANATDIIQGIVNIIDSDTAGTTTGFATAADSDTVTLNRSTTGSVIRGEWLEFEDIAAGLWVVRGQLANTGNGGTPFTAAVS